MKNVLAAIAEKFEQIRTFFNGFERRRREALQTKSHLMAELDAQRKEYRRLLLLGDDKGADGIQQLLDDLFQRARRADDMAAALANGERTFMNEVNDRNNEITQLAREIHQKGKEELENLSTRYQELLGPKLEEARKAFLAIIEEAGEVGRKAVNIGSMMHRVRGLIPEEERVNVHYYQGRIKTPVFWEKDACILIDQSQKAYGHFLNWSALELYQVPRWEWFKKETEDKVIHGLRAPLTESVFNIPKGN